MTAAHPSSQLLSDEWAQVEVVVRSFEEAHRQGRRPSIHAYLCGEGPRRLALLVELIHTDLEFRLKGGEAARLELYLERYPELDAVPATVLQLIAAEYRLRCRQAPPPRADEYARRFPRYAAELERVLAAGQDPPDFLPTQSTRKEADQPSAGGPGGLPAGPPRLAGYEILGELGRGGMGVVYRAHDRKRNALVALKMLPWLEPAALYRFKKEFRALADVTHPNLVPLYELVADELKWFFTMEFVPGVDFLTFVQSALPAESPEEATQRPGDGAAPEGMGRDPPVDPDATAAAGSLPDPGPIHPSGKRPGLPPANLDRLRDALRQLTEGVLALHQAGKLHRDVKPSNVLVTPAGRVVLLDFGLATTLDQSAVGQSTEWCAVGTVAYMAPEQGAARPVSAAGDWYSVGVMLYEALTGRLPFRGTAEQILADKQAFEPPPPAALAADVPEDLNTLCAELLRRAPEERPTGEEVRRRIGAPPTDALRSDLPLRGPAPLAPLLGRSQHLETMTEALRAVNAGRPATLLVHGRSGAGKSALVQHFLNGLDGEVLILTGRCYEREAVPFKALDNLIDALSGYLRRLPLHEAAALLPRDVLHLARVFPVLRRVEAVARAPGRVFETPDAQEVRRRASGALRELLGRLGERQPLVLFIDDLQWGDLDSAALIADLLRPPDAPLLLLLGCYRSEDRAASPFLRALLESGEKSGGVPPPCELAVEALSLAEARDLALTLLKPDHEDAVAAEAVARESGGNPFFICELVQHLRQAGPLPPSRSAEASRLDQVIWERARRLPEGARRLLEAVAVSGRPVRLADVCRALGANAADQTTLAVLRSGRLIRSTAGATQDVIETYHDRIRQTITANLPEEELRRYHGCLAVALEAAGAADPEELAIHFQGAGQLDKAGKYFARAAKQAAESLAFDHAARLYRLALAHSSGEREETRLLQSGLGDVLAIAGRGAEAAEAYLNASRDAPAEQGLRLRHQAALQSLISGHIDEGLSILEDVMRALGIRSPGSPRMTLLRLLLTRARLWWRGVRFRRREAAEVPPETLLRFEVSMSAVNGLVLVDLVRGGYFVAQSVLLALQAGEPLRIVRALAIHAGYTASTGGRWARAAYARLMQAAEAALPAGDHPLEAGYLLMCKGAAHYMSGEWTKGRGFLQQAEQIFRDRCIGVAWELDTTHTFALWSLTYLGEVAELTRRRAVLRKEAEERGDRYAVTNFSTYMMAVARLGADEPAEAQAELTEVMSRWSQRGFHVQHHNALLAQVLIHLYRGDGRAAWDYVSTHAPGYRASSLWYLQHVFVDLLQSRGRSAVAAAAAAASPRPLLRSAARDARRLERINIPWSIAWAHMLRAGIAAVEHDLDRSHILLCEAASCFDRIDMRLCAAAARRQMGRLLGGDEGRALVEQADAWMAGQTIKNPARMAAMYAPGFPD